MSPVPVRAPARIPARPTPVRPGPARPGPARPELRLVDNGRLQVVARRRRARCLATVASVLVVAGVLALAGVNAVLVSNQVRLDALEREVVEAQARHQVLRLEVATLEAPQRVVSTATERLGMVPPEAVTYVQPAPVPASAASEATTPATSAEGAAGAGPVPSPSWGTVKPYLSR